MHIRYMEYTATSDITRKNKEPQKSFNERKIDLAKKETKGGQGLSISGSEAIIYTRGEKSSR